MLLTRWFLDLLFPRECFQCQQPLDLSHPGFVCESCFNQIVFNRGSCCSCCGRVLDSDAKDTPSDLICSNCLELNPYFNHGISLFALTNTGRAFIHALKYRNGAYLRSDLVRIMQHEQERLQSIQGCTFVPVPLHFFRKWKRGYNQCEWITKALLHCIDGEWAPILRRTFNTPSQTSLTREERKQNVKGAFMMKTHRPLDCTKTYVLVDDVFTTGSTLNECAKVLHQHGAQNIRVFTLAHG